MAKFYRQYKGKWLTKSQWAKQFGNRWANYNAEERSKAMSRLASKRMESLGVEGRKSLGKTLVAARISKRNK